MNKINHSIKFIVTVCICLTMLIEPLSVVYAGVGDTISNENELRTAITNAVSGDILPPLDADITTTDGIAISGKDITINLAGHTLTIKSDDGAGLTATNSTVSITGGGECNVEGTTYGLMVETGGVVTVTGVSATGSGHTAVHVQDGGMATILQNVLALDDAKGIVAVGTDTSVQVNGSVEASNMAVTARGGAQVSILSTVDATNTALFATDEGSIQVNGNVSAHTLTSAVGCSASNGGNIVVNGNVLGVLDGVYASGNETTVTVIGDIQATAADSIGVGAFNGAHVTAHAVVSGGKYGIMSSGSESYINVYHDVMATAEEGIGVFAYEGGRVDVGGNAEGDLYGVASAEGSFAVITGNCTATDPAEGVGAYSYNGDSQICVLGNITGKTFIKVGTTSKNEDDYTIPTTRLGFITYNDSDGNTIWLKNDSTNITASHAILSSSGGTTQITITGTDLPDGIVVTAFLENTETSITGTTTGSSTQQTVTLTFPANTSTTSDCIYTLKACISGTDWMSKTVEVSILKSSVNVSLSSDNNDIIPMTGDDIGLISWFGLIVSGTVCGFILLLQLCRQKRIH